MDRPLMSLDYLLATARAAEIETAREANGFVKRFEPAIDTLLKLAHWFGPDPKSSPGATPNYYHGWAMGQYLNAGYTFASMYSQWRSAAYLEAQLLLRHLHEVLVQVVYLSKQTPERIEEHFIPKELIAHRKAGTQPPSNHTPTIPKVILFKTMFEAEASGWYGTWYSIQSVFAHARLGSDAFRIDHSAQPPTVTLGQHYNEDHASSLMIQMTALMRGFIARFPAAFPQWDAAAAGTVRDAAIKSMDEILDAQWQELQGSRDWLKMVTTLVGWTLPAP